MNKSIFFVLSIIFSLSLTIVFWLVSIQLNEQVLDYTDTFFRSQIERELEASTLAVRNDLIQGNLRGARNLLSRSFSQGPILGFDFRENDKPLLLSKKRGVFLISIPVYFNSDSHLWGYVDYVVSSLSIDTLHKDMKKNLLFMSFTLFFLMFISVALLYAFLFRLSDLLKQTLQNSNKDISFNSGNSGGILEILWRPLISEITSIGTRLIKTERDLADLRSHESLFQFSRQFSHDIRSPIGAISAVIKNSLSLPLKEKKLLESTILRIENLAETLLSESRRKLVRPVKISELEQLTIDLIQEWDAKKNRVSLSSDISEGSVLAHPVLFCSILSNLVNNSIDATTDSANPNISIRLNSTSSLFTLDVVDDGIGMSQEFIQVTLNSGFSNKSNGNGIGLSSAKVLISSWNGSFEISSEKGKGTKINISLPIISE